VVAAWAACEQPEHCPVWVGKEQVMYLGDDLSEALAWGQGLHVSRDRMAQAMDRAKAAAQPYVVDGLDQLIYEGHVYGGPRWGRQEEQQRLHLEDLQVWREHAYVRAQGAWGWSEAPEDPSIWVHGLPTGLPLDAPTMHPAPRDVGWLQVEGLSGLAVGAPLPRGITMEQRLAFAVGLLALDLPDAPAAHRLQWLGLALADPQAWSDEAVWASPRWYVHWPSPGSLERSRGRLERGLEALVEAPLPAAQFLAARDALEDRLRAAAEGKAALPLAVTFSLAEVSNPLVWGPDVVAALRPEAVRAASEAVLAANTVYAVSGSGPNAPGVVKRSQEGLFR